MPTTTDGKYFEYTKAGIAAANAHQIRINRKRQNMGVMKGGSRGYSFKATTENVRDVKDIKAIRGRYGDGMMGDTKVKENEQRVRYGGFGQPFTQKGRRNMKENLHFMNPFGLGRVNPFKALGGGLELPPGYKEEHIDKSKYNWFGSRKDPKSDSPLVFKANDPKNTQNRVSPFNKEFWKKPYGRASN